MEQEAPPHRRRSGPRRVRRAPEEARAALLAGGIELVAERSLGDVLGHLRINDIARGAGLTSGAFYHYWSGQEAYRAEVLDVLLAGDRLDVGVTAATGLEGLRAAAGEAARTFGRSNEHRLELALWAHDDEGLSAQLLRRARRTDEAWAASLGSFLAEARRAPDPAWELGTLATGLVLLSDGLRTQALMDPGRLPEVVDPSGRPWPLGGLLAVALLLGATEPGDVGPVPEPPTPPEPPDDVPPRRRRLVDLGAEAALAQPTANALDHIRADDVAAQVGVTIGAFYHYWSSQDDYRDDLVDTLFDADRYLDPEDVTAQAGTTLSATDLDEGVRRATSWYWSEAAEHPANSIQIGFHALDDPYIDARLGDETRALQEPWTQVLGALLDRFDRRLRQPLTAEQVVLGMGAAMDGYVVRHRLDPEGFGPDDEGWTRWGRACAAMVRGASAPQDDDRDLFTVGEEAFGP